MKREARLYYNTDRKMVRRVMKQKHELHRWLSAAMWGLLCLTIPWSAHAGKLYKWVDKDGNVTYQDQEPPVEAVVLQDDSSPRSAAASAGDGAQQGAAETNPVTLYSVPMCDTCDLVRMVLELNSIPFEEKNADRSVEVQDELQAKAGQLTVPTLIIGEQVLSGFSGPEIRQGLEAAGYTLAERGGPPQTAGASAEETQLDQSEPNFDTEPEPGADDTQTSNY